MLIDSVKQAIAERRLVEFSYSNEIRRVEPHLLGVNKNGVTILSAWQTGGSRGDGWRAFSVDKMGNLKVLAEKFFRCREGYNPNDSTMTKIISRC